MILSRLERLLAELKRRHVLRMGGLYAVGAWVVVQVAATTFPYLGLPGWAVTVAIVLAAVGLPVTIVLAWAYDLTPEGVLRDESGATAASGSRRRAWRARGLVAGLVIVVLALGAFAAIRRVGRTSASALDRDLAAVMPFRVAGGNDATAGLGEGMVDLLAMRLAGEQGVRAADARSALSAWARVGGDQATNPLAAAIGAARSIGAGRVITGSIVVAGRQVTIGATLLRTDDTRSFPQTESVAGSLDSLLYLVDRLTVALLARDAGVEERRLGGLTSLPALQAHLAGKADHRRGRYAEAVAHFQKSLELDSTFALAALALNISARRTPETYTLFPAALDLAYRHRARLSDRDQALLHAFSPRHPVWPSVLEMVAAFEQMLDRWPDDADAWFELGDLLLHYGQASAIDHSVPRAERAFAQALAIDSGFYLPLEHIAVTLIEQGKHRALRPLLPRLELIGADAARYDYLRWRIALAFRDTAGVRATAARLASMNSLSRGAIAGDAQWLGERLQDAERAIAINRSLAATSEQTTDVLLREHDLALNRGMVRRARALLERLPPPVRDRDLHLLRDALYSDGDDGAAEAAAARLRLLADAPPADTTLPRWLKAQIRCELAWWDLARQRPALAAAALPQLRIAPEDVDAAALFNVDDGLYCTALIDAWLAALTARPNVRALLQRADSINIFSGTSYWYYGNIITARLREQSGDLPGALSAWRRVLVGTPDVSPTYASTRLRETARLALLTGDTVLARDYYRRYVGLRSAADPALQPDLAAARAALARLVGERPR